MFNHRSKNLKVEVFSYTIRANGILLCLTFKNRDKNKSLDIRFPKNTESELLNGKQSKMKAEWARN